MRVTLLFGCSKSDTMSCGLQLCSTGPTNYKVISNHLLSWMKAAGSPKGGAGDEPKHHNFRHAAPLESAE